MTASMKILIFFQRRILLMDYFINKFRISYKAEDSKLAAVAFESEDNSMQRTSELTKIVTL